MATRDDVVELHRRHALGLITNEFFRITLADKLYMMPKDELRKLSEEIWRALGQEQSA